MLLGPIFLLFAGCFALGVSTPRFWSAALRGERQEQRPFARLAGGLILTLGSLLFVLGEGWEVGLAWVILWIALAATATTFVLSLNPRATLPAAVTFVVAAGASAVLF